MNIQFGSGVMFAVPVAGSLPANPTPYRFGVLQEMNVDFKGDLKKLYGQKQFPVATARGKIDVTLKGKLAVFDVGMLNQLYFAQPSSVGVSLLIDSEDRVVNATTNTATIVNTPPVITDYGVQYAATGQQLINSGVAAPAQGQYKVNLTTGVYTFNGAESAAGLEVLLSYTFSSNARGQTITLNNQLMGYAPEVRAFLYSLFRNKYFAVELNDVTLGSISIPSKLEDFWICDIEGSANADASGKLGSLFADVV